MRPPIFLLLILALLLPSSVAFAAKGKIKFELDGYYRLRLLVFDDLAPQAGDGQIGNQPTQGLWMHRARLRPKLNLGERFSFNITINMLDNSVGGDFPELPGAPEFFSGSILPNPNYRKSVNVERVWGEFLSPIGIWRFGRMGSNWGLGILANDGDDEGDDFGDTVDRVMLITKVGPIIIIPAVDKVSEVRLDAGVAPPDFFNDPQSIGGQTDDVDQYILALVYRSKAVTAGIYAVHRIQPATRSRVNVIDTWVKTSFGPVNFELEALYLTGFTEAVVILNDKIEANQWGVATETDYSWKKFDFGLDVGAASGDDADGATNLTLDNYSFDRNYRVALLLFRYIVADPLTSIRTITNAWYVKPYVRYGVPLPTALFSTFDIQLSVVHAQTLAETQFYPSGSYGTEFDFAWIAGLYDDRAEWRLEYGLLFPGTVFEDVSSVSDADSVTHGIQGRFLIRF